MKAIIMMVCKRMYCSHCGKEISEGTKFCPYCGASLLPKTEVVYRPVCPPRDVGTVWKGVAMVFFFGFLGLILVYCLCGDEDETKKGAWIFIGIRVGLYILAAIITLIIVSIG